MDRRSFILTSTAFISQHWLVNQAQSASREQTPLFYEKGSVLSEDIFVTDSEHQPHSLTNLIDATPTVLYIFGGGAMGDERPAGGIWCRDTFEDLYILRTVVDKYKDAAVKIIPVACPPVFHTHYLGSEKDVFTDFSEESDEFISARQAFIDSTQKAVRSGVIPLQPYYDVRMKLMINKKQQSPFTENYGRQEPWLANFRAADEQQTYGVPNLWLLNNKAEVITEPFRGNIYHPHGGAISINYTLVDVLNAIDKALL
jgi:hypothetical protein